MKKPDLLRAAIVEMMPEFATDPDRLTMWVEQGTVKSQTCQNGGFKWSYTLQLVASDFTRDPAMLIFIINRWLAQHQPDLLTITSDGYGFQADILDTHACDLQITLPLTEIVVARSLAGGGWLLETLDEPPSTFTDTRPLRPDGGPFTMAFAGAMDTAPVQVYPIEKP